MNIALALGAALVLFLIIQAIRRKRQMCPADTLQQLKSQGALLLDVRTPQEFAGGHAPGALNIPVATLQARFLELDRQKPILVCCASGARSAWAKNFLDAQGFQTVHNAGPWQRLIA